LKITKTNTISKRENYNVKEGLQYFLDNYFEWMFSLGGIPEELKEEANKEKIERTTDNIILWPQH
jgi:hypothetical protein